MYIDVCDGEGEYESVDNFVSTTYNSGRLRAPCPLPQDTVPLPLPLPRSSTSATNWTITDPAATCSQIGRYEYDIILVY